MNSNLRHTVALSIAITVLLGTPAAIAASKIAHSHNAVSVPTQLTQSPALNESTSSTAALDSVTTFTLAQDAPTPVATSSGASDSTQSPSAQPTLSAPATTTASTPSGPTIATPSATLSGDDEGDQNENDGQGDDEGDDD